MKIDDILAEHPWPWRVHTRKPTLEWTVWDVNDDYVDISDEGIDEELRDAFLELVEAHKYWKEKRDMEKNYATLKRHHEKAQEQIEIAHRIVNALKLNTLFSPNLQQALKNWETL